VTGAPKRVRPVGVLERQEEFAGPTRILALSGIRTRGEDPRRAGPARAEPPADRSLGTANRVLAGGRVGVDVKALWSRRARPGPDERVHEAYSPAALARLGEIKAKYDPTNFFRMNQNIQPS
jgi:hypothetical protein